LTSLRKLVVPSLLRFILPLAVVLPGLASGALASPSTSDELDAIIPGTLKNYAGPVFDERIVAAQIIMDRAGISPGVIDGRDTMRLRRALSAWSEKTGLPARVEEVVNSLRVKPVRPVLVDYVLTGKDVAGPFLSEIPHLFVDQAKLLRLSFTSVREALAERFHMDEQYLAALNPDIDFTKVGAVVRVADIGRAVDVRVTKVIADQARREVRAYDGEDRLVAVYPASIGSTDLPTPQGEHHVVNVAGDPAYTFSPEFGFQTGTSSGNVVVQPGPNNPVGTAWIGLSAKSYGIHGTAEPSAIGLTPSHGCIRLTNWDALELARMVRRGTQVTITPASAGPVNTSG
jgi:lipoprotein-anchoring transpeptidase ErfK/SrfK